LNIIAIGIKNGFENINAQNVYFPLRKKTLFDLQYHIQAEKPNARETELIF